MGRLPAFAEFESWRNVVFQNVDTASRRADNKAMEWIQEVEMLDTVTDESLMDEPTKRFANLDKA